MTATTTAPTLDMGLDLATATPDQLAEQRAALLAHLDSPEAGESIADLAERASAVATAIEQSGHRIAAADAARARLAGAPVVQAPAPDHGTPPPADEKPEYRTYGEAFVKSGVFRDMVTTGRTRSDRAHLVLSARAFLSTDYPSQATRVPGIISDPDAPLTILDVIDRQSISTSTIEWVQEVTPPGAAAEVAEGELKPESTWDVELKSDTLATIAHWIDISRQALADESQLQGYINGRMVYGLQKRLAAEVVAGNGTAPNLRGILNTPGLGAYTGAAGDDYLIQLRKARTVAELSDYAPDTTVLHPTDWEAVELSRNDNGTFRIAQPTGSITTTVWGMRVVPSVALPVGTYLIGGMREGVTLWERSGVDVYITDSDADKFKKNILTMLAELRAGLSVWRPKAIVKGTFTA